MRPARELSLGEAAQRFFGYAGPRFLAAQTVIALGLRPLFGPFRIWELVIPVAVVVWWPVQEWMLHRYVLHLRPVRILGVTFDPLFARKHRDHHRQPWNEVDTLLPLPVLLGAAVVNALLWWLLMPAFGPALTGIASASGMALLYEWTHLLTHLPYRPRGRYYARICARHRWHHFKNEHYWYGFTFPFVDDLLRTAPEPKSVETSKTCRSLIEEGRPLPPTK